MHSSLTTSLPAHSSEGLCYVDIADIYFVTQYSEPDWYLLSSLLLIITALSKSNAAGGVHGDTKRGLRRRRGPWSFEEEEDEVALSTSSLTFFDRDRGCFLGVSVRSSPLSIVPFSSLASFLAASFLNRLFVFDLAAVSTSSLSWKLLLLDRLRLYNFCFPAIIAEVRPPDWRKVMEHPFPSLPAFFLVQPETGHEILANKKGNGCEREDNALREAARILKCLVFFLQHSKLLTIRKKPSVGIRFVIL